MKTSAVQHRTVSVGHTPDMDDAFMFYAIAKGLVPLRGLTVKHVIEDIQALNKRALTADLDMTAISAAAYPELSDRYWIVSVGSSVGLNYGPLVITKSPTTIEQLSGKRIAVPGLQTTAYLLLRLALPKFEPVVMEFSKIPQAVIDGKADAGLVIHEWQLTYKDAGFVPALDLGQWWHAQTGGLPLPLGLNVVKSSLGRELAGQITTLFSDSIKYGMAHEQDALAYAMQYGRGTDKERSKTFVRMYVNEETVSLSDPCRQALKELFTRAHAAKLIPAIPRLDIIEPKD